MKFCSRFVFHFLTKIQLEKNITWFYNERGHGKGPVDGIVGTVKNQEGKIWSLCNRYTLKYYPHPYSQQKGFTPGNAQNCQNGLVRIREFYGPRALQILWDGVANN